MTTKFTQVTSVKVYDNEWRSDGNVYTITGLVQYDNDGFNHSATSTAWLAA